MLRPCGAKPSRPRPPARRHYSRLGRCALPPIRSPRAPPATRRIRRTGTISAPRCIAGARRRVPLALIGAVAVVAAGLGATEWQRRNQPVAVVTADAAPVRAAPYGAASAATTLLPGGALLVGRSYGPWREVSRKDGIHGWVLAEEIIGL